MCIICTKTYIQQPWNKNITIKDCSNILTVPNIPGLQVLGVINCPNLKTIFTPLGLQVLVCRECPSLRYVIPESMIHVTLMHGHTRFKPCFMSFNDYLENELWPIIKLQRWIRCNLRSTWAGKILSLKFSSTHFMKNMII